MAYDLKFWFESDGPTAMIAVHGDWEQYRSSEYGSLTTSKASSASTAISWAVNSSSEPWDLCLRQLVSASQAAREWTTGDKFDVVFTTYEDNDACDATLYLVIRVLSSDLLTVRGTLYSGEVNNVEWKSATYTRRHAQNVAIQNAVSQQLNDKIVIEVGARCLYTGSAYTPRIYVGSASATDLPLSDADVGATSDNPWIGFTFGAVEYEYTGTIPVSVSPTYTIARDYSPTGLVSAGFFPGIVSDPSLEGSPEEPVATRPWYMHPGRSAKWKH